MDVPEFFKNNLANWLVLMVGVAVLWFKFMPKMFADRRTKIENALSDAARAQAEGDQFLASQKARIENAEVEAKGILTEAEQVAAGMKTDIKAQTEKDLVEVERKTTQQVATQRQMVITELRSQAATVAVRIAEAALPGAITPNVKQGLQERFISQLDQVGSKG